VPKGHRRIGFASGGDSSRRRSGCRLVTIRVAIDGWRLSCQSRGLGNATPGDLGIAEGPVKSRLRYVARAQRLSLQEDGMTR